MDVLVVKLSPNYKNWHVPKSNHKNWSDYVWTTILLNKEYPANYKLHVLGDLQNRKINTKHFEIKQWEP